MQKLVSPQMRKLKKSLKLCLKEKILVDIFLIGSALKGKDKPNDIDVISLFRDKNYSLIEEINYSIKKEGDELGLKLHIEPLIVDNMLLQDVYLSVLHEGFSIKNMKFVSEIMSLKSYFLVNYNLRDKSNSDKVRFSYALYGRSKGEGLLNELKGEEVGKGAIFVPVEHESIVKDFFEQWNVKFKMVRLMVNKKG